MKKPLPVYEYSPEQEQVLKLLRALRALYSHHVTKGLDGSDEASVLLNAALAIASVTGQAEIYKGDTK